MNTSMGTLRLTALVTFLAMAACTIVFTTSCTPKVSSYTEQSGDSVSLNQEPVSLLIDITSDSDTVYICTGKASKRFHSSDSCEGIMQCTKKIMAMTRADAEKRHRTFCHKCYRDSVE